MSGLEGPGKGSCGSCCKGTEVSGLEGPGKGSWTGTGRIPEVSILMGVGLLPFGGDSVDVAKGAKSPEAVGGGLLEDGLSGAVEPASRLDDAVESWTEDVDRSSWASSLRTSSWTWPTSPGTA